MTHFLGWGPHRVLADSVLESLNSWRGRELIEADLTGLRLRLSERLAAPARSFHWVAQTRQGIDQVIQSLTFGSQDEVLSTDHEYPSCREAWRRRAKDCGFLYREIPLPRPVTSHADLVEYLWTGVTPRTKMIFFSHITCLTALLLPARQICQRARQQGILTMVDGAHAAGQIPLDIGHIDPDYYCACLHKWLGAPDYGAFIFARQPWSAPELPPNPALLAAEAALELQPNLQSAFQLAQEARRRLGELTGLPPLQPPGSEWTAAMVAVPIPWQEEPLTLQDQLTQLGFITNVHHFQDQTLLRICFGPEDRPGHLDALLQALSGLL